MMWLSGRQRAALGDEVRLGSINDFGVTGIR